MFTKLSFKTQITWLSTCLILMTVAFLTTSFWLKVASYVDQQIENQMYFAENVVSQHLASQERVLTTAASVLAADFGFKQGVATSDKNTIKSVLINHGRRINADLMTLLDIEGNLVTTAAFQQVPANTIEQAVKKLPLREVHAQVINIEDKVFQIIIVPVMAPRLIAYSIIGFEFDNEVLRRLKELTLLEVTLVNKKQVLGSSFSEPDTVYGLLQDSADYSVDLLLSTDDYFHKKVLLSGSFDVSVILSASLIEIHSDFNQLISSISIISVVVIIIAITFSRVLYRGMAVPLNLLVDLTKRISSGNLAVPKLNSDLPKEFTELYQGFSVMGAAIEHRENEIKYQAERDILTGLLNRHTMLNAINKFLIKQIDLVLITFNIKGFKVLNDTVGVVNGDALLKEIAARVNNYVKKLNLENNAKAATSRVNADEFMVAIPVSAIENTEYAIKVLQDELDRPFWLEDIRLNLWLYFGVADSFEHDADAERLMRRSTMAAVAAFKEQKVLRYYQQGEDEQYLYKLKLIEELKEALERQDGQLFMSYQPKLNLLTGKVDKVEALIRWVNREGQFVNPELFIGLAENAGLIVSLTKWVLKSVIQQISIWDKQGLDFKVSINLSAQDIQHEGFIEYLLEHVSLYQISSQQITLELTERDLAENEELVITRLTHLKSLGFEISVDDYGIGQSSLAKLKNLPVDELKIDKSFILTLDQCDKDQDIVFSTISLGHKLGLRVVAEGVENLESLTLLRQFNCDYAQGYYLSKAISAEQFVLWYQNYESSN